MKKSYLFYLFALAIGLIGPVSIVTSATPMIQTQGLFETATVIVTLPSANALDRSGTLSVKGPKDTAFKTAFSFSAIDAHSLSTSLFHLQPDTEYQLKIDINGLGPLYSKVTTLPEFKMPEMDCDADLKSGDNIQSTIYKFATRAGKQEIQICLAPGRYSAFELRGVVAKRDKPFIIRAKNPNDRPIIDGEEAHDYVIMLKRSANIWFDGLNVLGMTPGGARGGAGFLVDTARGLVIRNSVITGGGRWGILMNRSFQFPYRHNVSDDINLIERNAISGLYNSMQFDNNDYVAGNKVGMGLVIRGNNVKGGYDNFRHCGDEDIALSYGENTEHYYRITNQHGTQTALNIDVYDNIIGDAKDDNVEVDGVCSNYKFFRNRIRGKAANTISIAPLAPGPNFFIGNIFENVTPKQSLIKMNTKADRNNQKKIKGIATRNVFFFNNTLLRTGRGPLLNLWWGHAEHSLPIKNITFKNNIFSNSGKGRATDVKVGPHHIENPIFNYNLWFAKNPTFEWWDGKARQTYKDFFDFTKATGQEKNGFFALPLLDQDFIPIPESFTIDAGVVLPGISDNFLGNKPDIGAADIFHDAKTTPAVAAAVTPPPEQPTTGLPAKLSSKNKKTITSIDLTIPVDARRAQLVLAAYDPDTKNEGQIFINDQGPIVLFGDQTGGAFNGKVKLVSYEVDMKWLKNGTNQITFEHLESNGFVIHSMRVKFRLF